MNGMTAMPIRKADVVKKDIEVSVPEVSVVSPIGTISKSATQASMSAYGLCALQVSQKPWQNISAGLPAASSTVIVAIMDAGCRT